MNAAPDSLLASFRRAGAAARSELAVMISTDRARAPHALAMMRATGAKLRMAAENAAPSLITRHPSSLRAALLLDLAPVLTALRLIIADPRREMLRLSANWHTIEAELLANEHSDGPWLDFLAAEFLAGLESIGNPQSAIRNPPPLTAANAITVERTSERAPPSALTEAAARDLLPTHLDTNGLRDLDSALRRRAFFSARTTSAGYLKELKKLVERHITAQGTDNDLAQLRIEARQMLKAFGYTPEKGFKGDARLGVPSAVPGTLRDLGSERRLNLIFNTQASLMRGLAQQLRGLDRIDQFPSWELIRIAPKKAPRDWPQRWQEAGGPTLQHSNTPTQRLIAPKESEVWSVLGDSALFPDALDVDHPPFAFESGMGWREVGITELQQLGITPTPGGDPTRLVNAAAKRARDNATTEDIEDQFIGGAATLANIEARLRELEKTSPPLTPQMVKAMR